MKCNPVLVATLCGFILTGTANAEEKKPTWDEAWATWEDLGALLSDENLKPTRKRETLRRITFFQADAETIESLSYLKLLPHPEQVELTFRAVQAEETNDLAILAKDLASLKGISVSYKVDEPVTDAHLCSLSKISNLRQVFCGSFKSLQITDAGLKCLGDRCKLEGLTLHSGESFPVTDEGLKHFENMETLTNLNLIHSQVTGTGFRYLEKLPLESLILYGSPVSDDHLIHLGKLRSLERLTLNETKITGEGLVHLKKLPKLRTLAMMGTNISAKHLTHLKDFESLSELVLNKTKLGDQAIPILAQLNQVKRLSLRGTKLTKDGVARLTKLLPGTDISY